jgi:3-hydroxyisobutyrate dehydrogenase
MVELGAQRAQSAAEAVRAADVVLTMLADGDAVAQVMGGPHGAGAAVRPGSVWIQMSTVGVEWTQRLAALASARDLEFVDAPVSGSDGPARDAQLVVLASGPDHVRRRVDPLFDAIGRRTVWLGPAGGGTRLKVVLNNWLVTVTEAMAESLALTDAVGLEPAQFLEALVGSPLEMPYATAKGRAMLSGEFTPGFALRHALKDARLALDAARDNGVELALTDALVRRWDRAMPTHADDDLASVIDQARAA